MDPLSVVLMVSSYNANSEMKCGEIEIKIRMIGFGITDIVNCIKRVHEYIRIFYSIKLYIHIHKYKHLRKAFCLEPVVCLATLPSLGCWSSASPRKGKLLLSQVTVM